MFEKVLSFPLPYFCIFLQISITVSLSFFAYFAYQRLFVMYTFVQWPVRTKQSNKTYNTNLKQNHKIRNTNTNLSLCLCGRVLC